MAEAQNGTVVMEDVFEDTFMRFCQFVYGGDYEPPEFILEPDKESSSPVDSNTSAAAGEPSADDNVEADGRSMTASSEVEGSLVSSLDGPSSSPNTMKISKIRIWRLLFDIKTYEIKSTTTEFAVRCKTRSNETALENYAPVFLGYAQLYVFAEKWGIEALKTLSLSKLHQTLVPFKLYERRRNDIVELARYAYSEDNTPDTPNAMDSLRELVIHYITCVVESLNQAPEFKLLLEENGVFGRDLVSSMMKRIE